MKRIGALFVLLFILDILALFTYTQLVPMERISAQHKQKLGKSHGMDFYLDPILAHNVHTKMKFLVIFDEFKDAIKAEKILVSKGVKVLYKYKIIPALLVDGLVSDIMKYLKSTSVDIVGMYYNRVYYLPKYFIESPIVPKQTLPTTNQTAFLIGANVFWAHGYLGDNVTVAVIDTGVDKNHRELSGKVIAEKSFVRTIFGYDSDVPSPNDEEGHGTAVAGIIAGKGLDPRGQGMAPNALIMNAKVFTRGSGATLAGIVAAIEWATFGPDGIPFTGDEADVINMSLGGGEIYNSPTWRAIKAATDYGVVVVIAAGNEGQDQKNSMSIGDPGDAPWAITAGAANPTYTGLDKVGTEQYSSFGPTIALAVKPDIVAPSGTIVLEAGGDYTGTAWHGTSFSSPHTAGCAALLVNYFRAHGINKTQMPWLVKSLMVMTATSLYEVLSDETIRYEDLMVGAGALNLTAAYGVLESTTINSDTYPQWLYVLPTKIPVGLSNSRIDKYKLHRPYFPYFSKVFNGQTVFMNFTIISSKETTITVNFSGNFTNVVNINSDTTIVVDEPTVYWEFNFSVEENASEGYYSGLITFVDNNYGISIDVPMEFYLVNPKARMLFDLKHTDWYVDYRYGQYRLLSGFWEGLNVSIDTLPFGSKLELNQRLLSKYDVLFMPDTVSAVPIFDEIARYVGSSFSETRISWDEISAIYDFIKAGGVVIAFALDQDYHNLTNINELLSYTESQIYFEPWIGKDTTVAADVVSRHILMANISKLPYQGIQLRTGLLSEAILGYGDYDLAIVHQGFEGGALIALGTNFMFDNWAFLGEYPGSSGVRQFATNIINLATNWKSIIGSISFNGLNTYIASGSTIIFTNTTSPLFTLVMSNSTPLMNASWEVYVDDSLVASGAFSYSNTDGSWLANVDLSSVNSKVYYIRITAYFSIAGQVYSIIRAGRILIDSKAPQILAYNPVIMTRSNRSATIRVLLGDDCLPNITTLGYSINITNYTLSLARLNSTYYVMDIIISNDTLTGWANTGKRVLTLSMWVSVSDFFGRSSSETLAYKIYIDDNPPNVEVVSPQNGAFVKGTIQIDIDLEDDLTGITYVLFYVDGRLRLNTSQELTEIKIDTTKLVDGEHNISIVAVDGAGNKGRDEITVIVDNTTPNIKIEGIENSSTVSGVITFTIEVDDATSGVNNISVSIDNQTVNTTSESSLGLKIDTTKYANGEHTIVVSAWDKAGNRAIVTIVLNVSNFAMTGILVISTIIVVAVVVAVVFLAYKKKLPFLKKKD